MQQLSYASGIAKLSELIDVHAFKVKAAKASLSVAERKQLKESLATLKNIRRRWERWHEFRSAKLLYEGPAPARDLRKITEVVVEINTLLRAARTRQRKDAGN